MDWVAITPDNIKAKVHANIVTRAGSVAAGEIDPVTEITEDTIAEVRLAVGAANVLDPDDTKIPKALKNLTVRLIVYALKERVKVALSESEDKQRTRDYEYLTRLSKREVVLTPADNKPANLGTWNSENKLVPRTHPVPRPAVQQTSGKYANPDAPEDTGDE